MTAPKVRTPKRFRLVLRQQLLNYPLRLRVVALPDMGVADDALAVHQGRRRPVAVAETAPDGVVIVLDDGVPDAQLPRGLDHALVGLLPEELWRVDADDGQPGLLVLRVPVPQLRDHVPAIHSAVGPELDEDHPAAQLLHAERLAVDPRPARDLGRGFPRTQVDGPRWADGAPQQTRHHQ